MIVLNLTCAEGHHFEGWFPSSEAFDEQRQRSLVACTLCASTAVTRLPSSPRISKGARSPDSDQPQPEQAALALAAAVKAVAQMAAQCENVEHRFPEEARKIHYGEAEPRNIRGKASLEETRELLDEGISVLPLPVPPENETH